MLNSPYLLNMALPRSSFKAMNGLSQPFGGVGHINLPFNFSFGSLNIVAFGANGSKRRRKAVRGGDNVANGASGSRGGVKGLISRSAARSRLKAGLLSPGRIVDL